MRKNMIQFIKRFGTKFLARLLFVEQPRLKKLSSSFPSMYFEYFSYFIRLPRSQPRLVVVKKYHKLYPFIIPSDMKKSVLMLIRFCVSSLRCCLRSSFSLTVKGEYNHGLFTYLCLFLFVFNYRVMS